MKQALVYVNPGTSPPETDQPALVTNTLYTVTLLPVDDTIVKSQRNGIEAFRGCQYEDLIKRWTEPHINMKSIG